jgi:hypothetical protein
MSQMNGHHETHGDKHIKWDEEIIEEHNKERGTRQKVIILNINPINICTNLLVD